MKNKKILVTGATSFIGSNIVRRLYSKGHRDINILTRKTSDEWRLKDVPGLQRFKVDLVDKKKLEKVVKEINPNIIFHLAVQGIYGGVGVTKKDFVGTNLLGTINLIDACDKIDYDCFVNTGSSSEYGLKDKPMKEEDVCVPINLYGITKNASTQYGQAIARMEGKPIVSLRLFSPFGPFDRKERLISNTILGSLRHKTLKLASPDIGRDYIFIDDVVDLYMQLMGKAKELRGEIFNVGSGIQTKISEVVENIIDITNSKSKIEYGTFEPRAYDKGMLWVADMNKTQKCFDWKPRYSFREGLEESVKWFRYNLDKYKS
jgi:nucleoside-diphosphate-sugar epimerase